MFRARVKACFGNSATVIFADSCCLFFVFPTCLRSGFVLTPFLQPPPPLSLLRSNIEHGTSHINSRVSSPLTLTVHAFCLLRF